MAVHEGKVADIIALDIALRRNDPDWFEVLPPEIEDAIVSKLYYGHFFCHVLHQDYVVKRGHNPKEIKAKMLALLDTRGAKYPAEHNVGNQYHAEPDHAAFFRELDPSNTFNAGVGKMSKYRNYQ